MVRPFDLRDLALIRRLGERGVSLHTVSALVENVHPLRGALISMLVGGEFPTFVWKPDNGEHAGFLQLRVSNGGPQAFIHYISPRCDQPLDGENGQHPADSLHRPNAHAAWLALLDDAVAEVGRRGIHHVIAETDERGPELPVLRRSGFAVYTRQDIWSVAASQLAGGRALGPVIGRRRAPDVLALSLIHI